jgi:hypothetical protein
MIAYNLKVINQSKEIPRQLLFLNLNSQKPTMGLPPEIKEKNDKLQEISPQTDINVFNEKEVEHYLQTNAPGLYPAFKLINPAYKAAHADFFRYVYIYQNGGLYLDIKSGFDVCPFEQLQKLGYPRHGLYVSHWDQKLHKSWGNHTLLGVDREWVIWFILSEPGNKHLLAVIREMVWNLLTYARWNFGVADTGVLQTTGPIMYTKALMGRFNLQGIHQIDFEDLGLYPSLYERKDKQISEGHQKMFGKHYSELRSPVVLSTLSHRLKAIKTLQ